MSNINRRDMLKHTGLAAASLSAGLTALPWQIKVTDEALPGGLSSGISHSACRWCYNDIPLESLCQSAKAVGVSSIELIGPDEWPIVQKYGMTCAMGMAQPKSFGITKGFNRLENHDTLVEFYEDLIPKAAAAGIKQVICFSGNRNGLDDELGIQICAVGLKRVMKTAEKHGIIVSMELLNSKVDHHDYQCDRTPWGVELCKAIGSEQFKLLYDIYHMQIMEGDVIHTITDAAAYISHFHTGGVPGRAEIDDTQELNYPAIARAIAATGYKGFIAQEFMPAKSDKIASLKQGVQLCTV